MKNLSIIMLAALLIFSIFLCGCDDSEKQQPIIDNKIEASDLFGDIEEDTAAATETQAATDTESMTDTAAEAAE